MTAPVSVEDLNHLFRTSVLGVMVHRDMAVLYANERLAGLLQYEDADALIAHGNLGPHLPADMHRRLRERWSNIIGGTEALERNRLRHITSDGREIWLDVTDECILWQDGKPAILSTATDVSAAVETNESLLSSLRRLEASLDTILEAIPTGIAIFSASGRPRIVNSAMRTLFQEDPTPNAEVPPVVTELLARMDSSDKGETVERGVLTPMGRVVDLVARRMDDDAIMLSATDVSDWQAQQDKLRHMAERDALTTLFNRRGFNDAVKPALRRMGDKGQPCAVMVVDIDHFKQINDTYGHAIGDQALKSISHRLMTELRDDDVIARIGGEEFCIFLPGCTAETAEGIANRLRAKVSETPVTTRHERIAITASFGLKTWDGSAPPKLRELVAEADAALYRAKQLGRNRVVIA
ncbi:sensor domain-containing diguanylate cyclase [Kordiimonas marina]|uniref:sensor domain-containing diguanylate cyclase n=1 Tax=Kordiimonas marina TaxID=2872312 RepID=UPI001FF18C86|nr:diguanylate cyclase [Kordiimonas marina]MCJ9429711.1 diguanylate cyclase [Kordiimonas marina]